MLARLLQKKMTSCHSQVTMLTRQQPRQQLHGHLSYHHPSPALSAQHPGGGGVSSRKCHYLPAPNMRKGAKLSALIALSSRFESLPNLHRRYSYSTHTHTLHPHNSPIFEGNVLQKLPSSLVEAAARCVQRML